jgi:hypothetical protein
MNLFQIRQFVIRNIDGNGEEQARISPVNEFVGIVFNEVGILLSRAVSSHKSVNFGLNASLSSNNGIIFFFKQYIFLIITSRRQRRRRRLVHEER